MPEIRFATAIGKALEDAMAADPNVILFGQDVAGAGGPFGVTRGLHQRFGEGRVRDTPISEAAIAGAAVGAALTGLRPIFEIMFMDFSTLAMDALVNQAAKAHFMFGGQGSVPLVMRTPHGGGVNAGPQHSQCLEAWMAHIPGLKVVIPSTCADAYGLLRSAIEDPDPVIFIEHKAMYGLKGAIDDQPAHVPIGKARIARRGEHATVVCYGALVLEALKAAAELEREGISIEVVDLRSLQPWDEASVVASLEKTHHLVVAHEAVTSFGPGAEIAARMADVAFDELDGPIVRVGAPFMPVPFAKSLEARFRPNHTDVIAAVKKTLQ